MIDDHRNLVRRLLMSYGAFERADRRSMLRPVFVGLALMIAEPAVGEPRNFQMFSEFCYDMMEEVTPAMKYANKVPRVSIEDVFEEVQQEYPDTPIGKIALERASLSGCLAQ